MKIAQIIVPLLINKCKEVLQKLIVDDKKSGTLPLARSRLAEVSYLLEQLFILEIHPEIHLDINDDKEKITFQSSKKRHLLKLFPLFCDCITVKEPELKEKLKEIFHLIGKEIGLESS